MNEVKMLEFIHHLSDKGMDLERSAQFKYYLTCGTTGKRIVEVCTKNPERITVLSDNQLRRELIKSKYRISSLVRVMHVAEQLDDLKAKEVAVKCATQLMAESQLKWLIVDLLSPREI